MCAIVGPIAPLYIVAFALNRNEGWVESLVRVVLLIVVATAAAYLTAGGFDVRYPASSWFEAGARVAGVALLSAVVLVFTGGTWSFGGEPFNHVAVSTQVAIAALWQGALAAAALYRLRSRPSLAAARPDPAGVAAPVPGGPGQPTGPGFLLRWSHLVVALVLAGPLLVAEGLLMLIMAACGGDGVVLYLTMLTIVAALGGLPAIGAVLDRRRRSPTVDTAGSPGVPAQAQRGPAVAFGTMALAAFAHLVAVFLLLLVATAGYGVGTGTDC